MREDAGAHRRGGHPLGAIDRFIRRFGPLAHLIAILCLYAFLAVIIGAALAPSLWLMAQWWPWAWSFDAPGRWPLLGLGFGLCFFVSGFALLILLPLCNWLLPTRVKPYHGAYYSIAAVPWALHNGLFYLARYTFLPHVTLTPFGAPFLRAMGMRIGSRAFINTEFISDPCLITLGDDVVVGGSVHLFAHWGGGGHLAIAPVVIESGATIGQKSTVMGDVRVGAHAKVLPHSVLLPGTRVGAGETWAGVPARRIAPEEMEHLKQGLAGISDGM